MKTIFKRITAAVTFFSVVLTVYLAFDMPKKIIAEATGEIQAAIHSHKVCGGLSHDGCAHGNIEFEPFPDLENGNGIILRGKSYYLTKDIVLEGNGRIFVEKGVTNLCLNGHSIKKDNGQIIDINNIDGQRAELNICDCAGTGKIENTSDVSGYACITVIDDSSFNLYGGCIDGGVQGGGIEVCNSASWIGSGGTANIYGGSVQTRDNCGVWLHDYGSSLSVYGGEIKASEYYTVYVEGEHCKASVNGGKIIGSSDTYYTFEVNGTDVSLEISGGEVIGEKKPAVDCTRGTVEIKGGEVKSENTTGSCIYNNGTLIVSGGTVFCKGYYGIYNIIDYYSGTTSPGITTISGGTINSAGSAIYNGENSTVEIQGGKIISEQYSGIYNYGTLKISGGELYGKGTYTLENYKNAVLKISGGTAETANYALYNQSGGLAEISEGTLKGGNVCIWNNGTLNVSDGKIISEMNPVVNHGNLSISGGKWGKPDLTNYIKNLKNMKLSGSPSFINTSIWLASDDNIEITGELAYSAPCSIYIDSAVPRIITSGWSTYMGEQKPSDYFKSPYSLCTVAESNGEALLRRYIITFNANGGTCEIPNTSVNDNGNALSLPEAAKEKYTFDGWYTEKDGGDKITADTVFTCDTELYAHWSECNHIWSGAFENDDVQHWKVCTICGTENDKANHQWDNGVTTKEPTEDESGIMLYTCTICNAEKTEDIAPLGHSHTYSDEWTSDENNHWHAATCGHDVKSGEAEHNFGAPAITPSTCTKQGSEEYVCQICGYKKTVPLDLAEHSFDDVWQKDGDYHWKVCTICNTEKVSIAPHSWNEGETAKQPTEDEAGVMLYTCTVCNAEKTEDIAPLGHTHTYSDEWTSDENNHWHAATCGHNVKSGEAEHNFGAPTITPSTCTKQGSEEYVCQICGYKKTVPLDLAEHSFDDVWQKDGDYHWKVCTICNTEKSSIALHIWNDGEIIKQPTEDEAGVMLYTCTVCQGTKTETIPAADDPSNPDSGNISIDVQPGENAPDTKLKTSFDELVNAVLTPEEQESIKNGIDIKIILIVNDATESVPFNDKAMVETAIRGLSDYKLGQYLDLNLLKIIGNAQEKIIETNAPITVMFEVPETLRGEGRNYSVIRIHNGEATVLSDQDDDKNTITIKTDKFSTYALAYSEKKSITPPAGGNFVSNDPTPPDEIGSGNNEPASPDESGLDNSDPTISESGSPDSGNTPSESSGESSNAALPSDENFSADASGSDMHENTPSIEDNNSIPSEIAPTDHNDNPSTGIAVSFVPLVTVVTILTIAIKRKKK